MSLLRSMLPTARTAMRGASVARPATQLASAVAPRAAMPVRSMNLAWPNTRNNPEADEESEYVHARDQLLGLAGSCVFIAYAAYVLAGEPAHEAAHPYYQVPYSFVKRSPENGAQWWPGRQCQFFEFNCFQAAYEEADELLREQQGQARKH